MRLPRSSRTHHSHHHDNPDEGEVPVSMVPQVGLKLSGNTSSFNFTRTIPVSYPPHAMSHMSCTVFIVCSLQPLKPASTKVTQATTTPPNYSFSTPKQVTSESSVQVGLMWVCISHIHVTISPSLLPLPPPPPPSISGSI